MTARPTTLRVLLAALAAGCGRPAPTPPQAQNAWRPAPAYLRLPADESGPMPARLSETGAFADTAALAPIAALDPYDVNVPFWADGAGKRRWIAIPDGPERVRFSPTGEWSFPPGTVFVKHFERPDGARLETRLLVCDGPGKVRGAAYRWRADGS